MDFNKCKNIVIVLLIVLNIPLFYFNNIKEKTYDFTDAKKTSIVEVLNTNNIFLEDEVFVELEKSKKQILLVNKPFEYRLSEEYFFNKNENVSRTVESNETIFVQADKTMRYKANVLELFSESKVKIMDLTKEKAIELSQNFIDEMDLDFKDLILYEVYQKDEGFALKYVEQYANEVLFCNYIYLEIDKTGIKYGRLERYEPLEFQGKNKPLVSYDKTLLRILPELNNEKNLSIDRIELAYDLEGDSDKIRKNLLAVPYYFISIGNKTFKIDAFTNNLYDF